MRSGMDYDRFRTIRLFYMALLCIFPICSQGQGSSTEFIPERKIRPRHFGDHTIPFVIGLSLEDTLPNGCPNPCLQDSIPFSVQGRIHWFGLFSCSAMRFEWVSLLSRHACSDTVLTVHGVRLLGRRKGSFNVDILFEEMVVSPAGPLSIPTGRTFREEVWLDRKRLRGIFLNPA